VSEATKKCLRVGGSLIADSIHGDAGLAQLVANRTRAAVAHNRNGVTVISDKNLDQYFQPKKDIVGTQRYLQEHGKGLGYTHITTEYIFEKVW